MKQPGNDSYRDKPLAHEQAQALLHEYAATAAFGGSPAAQMPAVAAHLAGCAACRARLDELLELTDAAFAGQMPDSGRRPQVDLSFLPQPAAQPYLIDRLGRVVLQFSEALLASLRPTALAGAMRGQLVARFAQPAAATPGLTVEVYQERDGARVQVVVDVPSFNALDQQGSRVLLEANGWTWEGITDETGCVDIAGVPIDALPALRVVVTPK